MENDVIKELTDETNNKMNFSGNIEIFMDILNELSMKIGNNDNHDINDLLNISKVSIKLKKKKNKQIKF